MLFPSVEISWRDSTGLPLSITSSARFISNAWSKASPKSIISGETVPADGLVSVHVSGLGWS